MPDTPLQCSESSQAGAGFQERNLEAGRRDLDAAAVSPQTKMKKEFFVAETAQLHDGDRKVVPVDHTEVGVYRVEGKLYAYENLCHHQGGPACEGLLMPKVEEVLAEDRTYQRRRFNYNEWHIVCPWHAWEYDLQTGEYVVNRRIRLRKFEVLEKDGKIFVLA